MTNWGIIGAGNIAARFSESLKNVNDSCLYAISGRNEEKLKLFAAEHPCQKIYVGHENLLADENVDAVYIALPHDMHAEWIVKAAQYHKDILVEKPAVISQSEALEVQKAVKDNGVVFMEAMKNLYVPAFNEVLSLIRKGTIGKITDITVQHGFELPKDRYGKSCHTNPGVGGCLNDIGCYGIGFLIPFVTGEPVFRKTYANTYKGVDLYVSSDMMFDDIHVDFTFAFDRNMEAYGLIQGEKGTIKVSPLHRPNTYEICMDGNHETVSVPYDNDDFFSEISYFEQLRKDSTMFNDIMPVEESVRAAGYMDAIRSQFTDYDESDLKLLERQEKTYTIEQITSADAFAIGSAVIELLPDYDRGVSCQVVRESDGAVIFQYISDDKKEANLKYAAGKRQAIFGYSHSSAWLNIAMHIDSAVLQEHSEALPSGGAFPLKNEKGELIASMLVSGLHEGKDHELILRALEKVTGRKAEVFVKAIG